MKNQIKILSIFFCFLFLQIANAQRINRTEIEQIADSVLPSALNQLIEFLAIANDGNYPLQIEDNLKWCKNKFNALGFDTQVLRTSDAPLLFAEKINHGTDKSILFYLQIDGQPVDILEWEQDNPYSAVIKKQTADGHWEIIENKLENDSIDMDWRVFARSSSDSKGPAMSFITALDVLTKRNIDIPYSVKVIMDFQEELGSPTLPYAVEKYKNLFKADAILIMDGTRHLSNLPTLTYGARGIATATLKVFGPKQALHSGQYGNFAPNPVFEAARLIASMKDEKGRVLIDGFYNGIILTEKEKNELNKVPEDLNAIMHRLGISESDAVGETYQEALQFPTLNIRGLKAAWVGKEVRTLIPEETTIEIDMRLVPESDGERLMKSLKKHISNQGFHLVDSLPTNEERKNHKRLASFNYRLGSKPFRTSFDKPIGKFLEKAMQHVFDDKYVRMRTTGGSQPIAPFVNALQISAVSVRIPNPDNSIHAPNENLRIGNFLEGIITCLAILNQNFE